MGSGGGNALRDRNNLMHAYLSGTYISFADHSPCSHRVMTVSSYSTDACWGQGADEIKLYYLPHFLPPHTANMHTTCIPSSCSLLVPIYGLALVPGIQAKLGSSSSLPGPFPPTRWSHTMQEQVVSTLFFKIPRNGQHGTTRGRSKTSPNVLC